MESISMNINFNKIFNTLLPFVGILTLSYGLSVLVYINLFKQKTEAKGTITDNNGVLLQAISGTNHVKGSMYGVAFDVSDYSSIMIEGGWVRSSWDTLAEESFKPYGLNFIRKW